MERSGAAVLGGEFRQGFPGISCIRGALVMGPGCLFAGHLLRPWGVFCAKSRCVSGFVFSA